MVARYMFHTTILCISRLELGKRSTTPQPRGAQS
jgi:hypothetical protein